MTRQLAATIPGMLLLAATLTASGGPAPVGPRHTGFVDPAWFESRQLDYLHFATRVADRGSILNTIAHLERDLREPSFHPPRADVPLDAWDRPLAKLETLQDTRDFDALYLLNALLGYRGHPLVPEALWQRVEDTLLDFKFWYTEPTPPDKFDDSFYWTENHQIIYHTLEYLMGQEYPDRVFTNDGRLGAEHRDEARARILRWLDERSRFGFFEWHSNVYYQKDLTPLLTLVEYADDEDLATRAAMILDQLLFDLALHTFRGAFGVTHGRSQKKDKNSSLDDDTWNGVKLLFDTSTYPYQSAGAPDATLLARARKYRMPEIVLRVARAQQPFADRERMGIAVDEFAPLDQPPVAPYGFDFGDEDDLTVWWGMQAWTLWPVVPLTLEVARRDNLFETTLFRPFKPLSDAVGDNIQFAKFLARSLAWQVALELLKEVNTYTSRTADYMLSSAQDYRAGAYGAEYHAWQATFDANAIVFTTHPATPVPETTDWRVDAQPGYWTGTGSMPRSAQHENVAIHIYAPQFPPNLSPPLDLFPYEPYTHAYFPQDHFDEVETIGSWSFGRLGDGYLALYSWRPTQWIHYDPARVATRGMIEPFDLRADGGPENVWIVECGRRADWQSFAAFRAAILDAPVTVVPAADPIDGFQVHYASPSLGPVSFGWHEPLVVAGQEVSIRDYPRYQNPWSTTPFLSSTVGIADDEVGVLHDFAQGVRHVFGPPCPRPGRAQGPPEGRPRGRARGHDCG